VKRLRSKSPQHVRAMMLLAALAGTWSAVLGAKVVPIRPEASPQQVPSKPSCGCSLAALASNAGLVKSAPLTGECQPPPAPSSPCSAGCHLDSVTTQDWCRTRSDWCSIFPCAHDELWRRRRYAYSCNDGYVWIMCDAWLNAGLIATTGCVDPEGNRLCCSGATATEPRCAIGSEKPCRNRR
jgi:hypothetical protein